jgi:outer membrane immunogenic protein
MEAWMKRLLLTELAIAAWLGASANAADLYRATPSRPSSPVPAYFTWTGCYAGGNAGGIWANPDWIYKSTPMPAVSLGIASVTGGLAGIQAGCNYQVVNWVVGIQGDYDWTSASGSRTSMLFPRVTNQSNIRSLASVTARVGYSWDRFLLYVKGGAAWERDDYSMAPNALISGFALATAGESRSGWTAGVGGEYVLLDWLTVFLEYDFYGFGTRTNTFANCTVSACGAVSPAIDITNSTYIFKAGLNLKFGPSAPPVK